MTATVDPYNRVADLAIMIGEDQGRGIGLGFAAWQRACDMLFDQDIRKITAGTMEVNEPMLGLAYKAGMIEEGRRKRHFLWEGRVVDLVMFAKFKLDTK